jgi:hypothetical protein
MITIAPDAKFGTILGQGLGQGISQGYLKQKQTNEGQTAIQQLAQGLQANPDMPLQQQLLAAQQMLQGLPPDQQKSAMDAILQNALMRERGMKAGDERSFDLERLRRQHEYSLEQDAQKQAADLAKEELKNKYQEMKDAKREEEEAKSQEAFSTLTTLPNFLKMDDAQILKEAKNLGLSAKQTREVYALVTQSKKNFAAQKKEAAAVMDRLISQENALIPKTAGEKAKKPYVHRVKELIKRKQELLDKMDANFGKGSMEDIITEADILKPIDLDSESSVQIYTDISKNLFNGRGYFTLDPQEKQLFNIELAKRGYGPPQEDLSEEDLVNQATPPQQNQPASTPSVASSVVKNSLLNAANPALPAINLLNRLFG